jgi:phospholipid/cholesterol/gamma-HCH transport system permease protein
MAAPGSRSLPVRALEELGQATLRGLDALGFGAHLLAQSLAWIVLGRRRGQTVRPASVFSEMMQIAVRAIPIVSLLSGTVGVMLALQGIFQLRRFGAEGTVVLGLGVAITREFAPLITGILVAGRSGSALAARLATMTISQEVDALRVMGVNPVRFLVVPSLLAMMVGLPALVVWANLVSLLAAGAYVSGELGMTLRSFFIQTLDALEVADVMHGLWKSLIFGVVVAVIGIVDGSAVTGGAEGVGRVTTNSVVHAITAIVLTDMLFVFATTR